MKRKSLPIGRARSNKEDEPPTLEELNDVAEIFGVSDAQTITETLRGTYDY